MMQTPSPVLIVEGDALLGLALRSTLEDEGCSVLWRRSADEGMAAARAFHPTLILLDLRLAGPDGREFLRALKADPSTHEIPVVVVSAEAGGLAEEERALAHVVLPAPFSIEGLLDAVRSVPTDLDATLDDGAPISAADQQLMALCEEALRQTGGDQAAADQLVAMRLMRELPEDAAARWAVMAEWDRLIRAAEAALERGADRAALESWVLRRLRP
jgi:CheY-like chemotaxis protein